MFAFEENTGNLWGGIVSPAVVTGLVIILAIVLVALITVTLRYQMQQRDILREEWIRRDVARRRRIRLSDKQEAFERDNYTCQICGISRDFLDDLCPGLGDYLLLEADHIRSVSQGGTGRDIDNIQCLCWRCNRKKGGMRTNEEVRELIDYGIDFLQSEE